MARLSIVPTDVTFSTSTKPRIECELNLGDEGSPFQGMSATLVVYDAGMYLLTAVGRKETERAQGADRDLAMPGFMAESFALDVGSPPFGAPNVTAGSGVLLTLSGTLEIAPNKKWFLNQTSAAKQVPAGSKTQIDLFMRDTTGAKVVPAGVIGYFDSDMDRETDCTLLFRLVSTEGGSGNVIAASMGAQGGAPNPKVVLHVRILADDSDAPIGQPTAPNPFAPPKAMDRVTTPDLTGFYETTDRPDVVRPLCVQINQAGKRIAGWVSDMPRGVPDRLPGPTLEVRFADPPTVTQPHGGQSIKLRPNIVFAGASTGRCAWSLTWWAPEVGEPDPDHNLVRYGTADVEACAVGQGTLSLAPGSSPTDAAVVLILSLDTPYGPYGPFPIVRTRAECRWPTQLIDDLPRFAGPSPAYVVRSAQDYLRATQVSPLHSSYMAFVRDVISTKNPALMRALTSWFETSGAVRDQARENLSNEIQRIFAISRDGYKDVIADGARTIAAAQKPPLDGGNRTLLDWFEWVVGDYWDRIRAEPANNRVPDVQLFEQNVDRGFRDLGVAPTGRFQYVINFHQAHVTFKFGVGISPILYTATVTRQVVRGPGEPSDDPAWGSADFFGFATDFAVGAAAGLEAGTGGALIGTATFGCSIDLAPKDFHHAIIGQVGLIVGDLGIGPFGVTAVDREFMLVRLSNGVDLTTTQLDNMSMRLDVKVTKDGWSLKKALKLDPTLVVVHTVWTILVLPGELKDHVPTPDKPPETTAMSRDVWRTCDVLFDYNSAELNDRDQLELRLAVDRFLFTAADGSASSTGYTSPEGNVDYNLKLSAARAATVRQAVADAFGMALRVKSFTKTGLGEGPGVDAGLINPPAKDPSEKARMIQESHTEWPKWRKVDLRAEGILVARLMVRPGGATP